MQGTDSSPHRRWTNRDLVRERDHRLAVRAWKLLLGVALAAAPTAVYLHQQNECLKLSYEAVDLRTELESLQEEERRLRTERTGLESLDVIESWAIERHGLVRPTPEQVVVVRDTSPAPGDLMARGGR